LTSVLVVWFPWKKKCIFYGLRLYSTNPKSLGPIPPISETRPDSCPQHSIAFFFNKERNAKAENLSVRRWMQNPLRRRYPGRRWSLFTTRIWINPLKLPGNISTQPLEFLISAPFIYHFFLPSFLPSKFKSLILSLCFPFKFNCNLMF
jgi:hypothetical protein